MKLEKLVVGKTYWLIFWDDLLFFPYKAKYVGKKGIMCVFSKDGRKETSIHHFYTIHGCFSSLREAAKWYIKRAEEELVERKEAIEWAKKIESAERPSAKFYQMFPKKYENIH